MQSAPYVTTKRPPTEPYEIWKERRRLQKKAMKEYLRGTLLPNTSKDTNATNRFPKPDNV